MSIHHDIVYMWVLSDFVFCVRVIIVYFEHIFEAARPQGNSDRLFLHMILPGKILSCIRLPRIHNPFYAIL